jgi:hypothetical protein
MDQMPSTWLLGLKVLESVEIENWRVGCGGGGENDGTLGQSTGERGRGEAREYE